MLSLTILINAWLSWCMGWHRVLKLGLDWPMTFLMTQNYAKISKFGRFYPTNIPMLENRHQIYDWLNAFKTVDPEQQDVASQHAVLIGHSMGGGLGVCWYQMMTWRPKSNRWLPPLRWIIFQQATPHLSVMRKIKRSVTASNPSPTISRSRDFYLFAISAVNWLCRSLVYSQFAPYHLATGRVYPHRGMAI